ncbi:helix-turn-helix domain-containing protein [Brachybacterium massiliense]|uniref:helix-turn-helix domain-containing protein n=1 Tax=Brachybacterium massiliense TaxID=1755098 RepID=UPI000B3BAF7E|nr:helix-turn-helix transcriptional regulator [Brachybacterium massiliense]
MSKVDKKARIAAITAERKRLNMTQAELAAAADVSLKTVGNMEAGRTAGQEGTIARMEAALGLNEATEYDESTAQLLALMGPLIQRIPESQRATPIAQCIAILASAGQG